jgi:hypothetical protein
VKDIQETNQHFHFITSWKDPLQNLCHKKFSRKVVMKRLGPEQHKTERNQMKKTLLNSTICHLISSPTENPWHQTPPSTAT